MSKVKTILVNICRFIVAPVLIFSGYVKAVDPLGTQYKIQDYLQALGVVDAVPDWITLGTSVALCALEFTLGVLLLFAINRRIVSRLIVAFMSVMTVITLWLAIANPVQDCGCFGDAVHLTNWQTFWKNVVLLAMSIIIMRSPMSMVRFISKPNQWIVRTFTVLYIVVTSLWSLWDLPRFDFRPYHVGANIPEGMEIPEGEELPKLETTFIMEKDGEQREFTLDNYPDSTWTFIDSKTVQVSEGYVPPIHDFSMVLADSGDDITDIVLSDSSYTFLLIAPFLEHADDSSFGAIDQIYEYAEQQGYAFYGVTSSDEVAIDRWRNLTGAEYPFCHADATTLKTVIRSNPGLVLLHGGGTIIRKWSHNSLPDPDTLTKPLDQLPEGHMPNDSVPRKLLAILLWFALPLIVLTIADRLWAWTKWIRRKSRKQEKKAEEEANTPEEPEKPENPEKPEKPEETKDSEQ